MKRLLLVLAGCLTASAAHAAEGVVILDGGIWRVVKHLLGF